MIKKTLTFEDLDGNPRTEDFWFHLSKPELHKLSVGGYDNFIRRVQEVMQSQDQPKILELFTEIFQTSVGKRSDDNVRFIKNQDVTDYFMQSDAFSVLYMELLTNTTRLAEFVTGLVPRDIQGQVESNVEKVLSGELTEVDLPSGKITLPSVQEAVDAAAKPVVTGVVELKPWGDYSRKELLEMPDAHFQAVLANGTKGKNIPYPLLQIAMQRAPQAE